MLLRVTNKLSKKLKLPPLTTVKDNPGLFLEWYANVFTANRVQYILTTEANSLFSVVLYGRGITNVNLFINSWLTSLKSYLSDIGKESVFNNIISSNTNQFTFSKVLNKSILGSMTNIVVDSKFMLEDEDMSPRDLSQMINETPFNAIDFHSPICVFNQL